nr:hypothetical protein [Arthrobacter sp. SRS-W-1-2016]
MGGFDRNFVQESPGFAPCPGVISNPLQTQSRTVRGGFDYRGRAVHRDAEIGVSDGEQGAFGTFDCTLYALSVEEGSVPAPQIANP